MRMSPRGRGRALAHPHRSQVTAFDGCGEGRCLAGNSMSPSQPSVVPRSRFWPDPSPHAQRPPVSADPRPRRGRQPHLHGAEEGAEEGDEPASSEAADPAAEVRQPRHGRPAPAPPVVRGAGGGPRTGRCPEQAGGPPWRSSQPRFAPSQQRGSRIIMRRGATPRPSTRRGRRGAGASPSRRRTTSASQRRMGTASAKARVANAEANAYPMVCAPADQRDGSTQ
eukprot:5205231-Pyramimonas_sp.AAC.1